MKYITLVETIQIGCEDDLLLHHKQNLADGYEGTMVRHGDTGYESNKRSSSLLKYKDFKDISLPIIDITPNEANTAHGTPVFELGGKQFKSGLKMSHAEREEFLTNRADHIGKMAELRFFEYSEEGTPRFPVMVGFREDK